MTEAANQKRTSIFLKPDHDTYSTCRMSYYYATILLECGGYNRHSLRLHIFHMSTRVNEEKIGI